jgi:hypothetical protein
MVDGLDPRTQRLTAAGYDYDRRVDVWFNVATRRALGGASMRAHDDAWLAAWLAGHQRVHALPTATSWASSPPSKDTRSRSSLA